MVILSSFHFSFIKSIYDFGILFSECNKYLNGYLVSPSNKKQILDIFEFRKAVVENRLIEKIKDEDIFKLVNEK